MRLVSFMSWVMFALAIAGLAMAVGYSEPIFVGSAVALMAAGALFHGLACIIRHLEELVAVGGVHERLQLPAAQNEPTVTAPRESTLADLEKNLERIRSRQG